MNLSDFLICEPKLKKLVILGIVPAVRKVREAMVKQKGELAGSKNVYGESQLGLDVKANQIVMDCLTKTGLISQLASEEMEDVLDTGYRIQDTGSFSVAFDPLDGSSLVDVNFAVGSIFGIYEGGNFSGRTGQEQVAACYAVYGPHTTLVLTVKKGVHEFRLNENGEFFLTKENLKVSGQAKHFAPGNLRSAAERRDYLKLVNQWIKNGLTLRYSGGMVPDINHILLKGDGIFTYPGYSKAPEGKLRLLFECAPMALLMEQAGGAASDGQGRILEKQIQEVHQRTPIFIGSRLAVEEACKVLKFK